MNRICTQIKYCLIFVACYLMVQSCNVINPSEQTPTYIHVDSFHFVRNPLVNYRIADTHQITCVWAYYNNYLIGVFDLPCTIPVITNGDASGQLELAAGVATDGLNSTLGAYPFYELDTFDFKPQPGKVINHLPVTKYFSDILFTPLSSFSGGGAGNSFVLYGTGVPMEEYNDSLMGASGIVTFSAPADTNSTDSGVITFSPALNQSAYVEFDYKSTVPIYVGLQANLSVSISSSPYFLAGINPSSTWKKFYLSVADFNAQYQGSSYNFYVKAAIAPGVSSGSFEIANVQFLTY